MAIEIFSPKPFFIAKYAARGGHIKIVEKLLENYEHDLTEIAISAAGHLNIVHKIIKKGTNYTEIAKSVLRNSTECTYIIKELIGLGAEYAAFYNHDIIFDLVCAENINYDKILLEMVSLFKISHENSERRIKIVRKLIELGANYRYEKAGIYMARYGMEKETMEILDHVENYGEIILGAVVNGHRDIMHKIINRNKKQDYDYLATCAVVNGHANIVDDILYMATDLYLYRLIYEANVHGYTNIAKIIKNHPSIGVKKRYIFKLYSFVEFLVKKLIFQM
jgi:hypothetical protein